MIEISNSRPDTRVQPAEYQRLLGYPRDFVMDGRALELATAARAWYDVHGRPWVYAREVNTVALTDGAVLLDGHAFTSERLLKTLREAGADSAIVVAVSAGPELEREAQRLWKDEKPDEYFFLEIYGSAVVEHLVMMTGAQLCAHADDAGVAVLPHYSPGYPSWPIGEQAQLLSLIGPSRLPAAVEVLESGMLRPKKSLLAVFGLTPHVDRVRRLTDLVPCEACSLPGCEYRRKPFARARFRSEVESMRPVDEPVVVAPPSAPLDLDAKYSVNAKALRRWIDERLSITHNVDGSMDALFRYEGTTCSNMGRSFEFHYSVKLSPRDDRYIVLDQLCAPAPGDEGHTFMCRYRAAAPQLMASITEDKPLLGRPLDDVLSWHRATGGASCYCEAAGGRQKWGLVLETIHYALAQQEKARRDLPLAQRA
jgi:hypothetical protein